MSEPTFGFQPRRPLFPELQLKLDPEVERMMLDIEARMRARQLIQQWLQPDFQLLLPHWSALIAAPPPNPFTAPMPAPAKPAFTPGAGPATPRPAEFSDVAKAVYKLPAVQKLVEQAHDKATEQLGLLRQDWKRAGTGERIAMVSLTGLVVGTTVTGILANQPTRKLAFDLLKGKDIPVPKVDGLSFKLMDRGAGATVPLGVPGLSASGHYAAPSGKPVDYGVTVTFDLMQYLKKK
jgi:hypothetical protein